MCINLDLVDWAQIASATASAFATIFAAVTIKNNSQEKHAMLKPIFIIDSTIENKLDRKYRIVLKNIGFDRLNSFHCYWDGIKGVKLNYSNTQNKAFAIGFDMDEVKNIQEGVQGKIVITYTNILGKKYTNNIEIKLSIEHRDDYTFYSLDDKYANKILG